MSRGDQWFHQHHCQSVPWKDFLFLVFTLVNLVYDVGACGVVDFGGEDTGAGGMAVAFFKGKLWFLVQLCF